MKIRYSAAIIGMIVLYVAVVRRIFGVLFAHQIFPSFSLSVPETYLPFAVALLCIIGLRYHQQWAWWLTLVATIYELIAFVVQTGLRPELSPVGLAVVFKLAWLLTFLVLLIAARKRVA
ncbi:membrane-anchored protein YejM (alkaline phosphatase superfamily) [Pelomonas aquatica]|uniref:Membrane-anchored protein YejM (Alkaline phosphatase superfamily) n=1 Tax=Pelomonas aquatica TaxID=431058 RepID=A0ABU1ZE25_9BURK|nr:hypothetical protein [Pelomonas aquatica]MDR7298869.1 membrane-anchored protein YejM (alkaline phosphatase superfamily) [Pelomonas aquatica]